MAKMTRRESRETAFALLFEWSFKDDDFDEIVNNAIIAREIVVDSFTRELADKVIENRDELDSLIGQYSQGWKLQRISKTALTVLRMSFCELTHFHDIPVGVSINEAVELLKKFGTDEEAAYLNGILGNFEKVRKGLKEAPSRPKTETTVKTKESIPLIDINEQHEQKEQSIQKSHQEHNGEVELIDDIVIEVE